MPDYRRYFVPGGTFFFTPVTANRYPLFNNCSARTLLRQIINEEQNRRPFCIQATVLLPDHLHAIWALPPGDSKYSLRWSAIKANFARQWLANGGSEQRVSGSKRREGRRGVWQPRFIEHTIRDEDDLHAHADYIHYNPVKHGWVSRPADWRWSTFHRFVAAGRYEATWGAAAQPEAVRHLDDTLLE